MSAPSSTEVFGAVHLGYVVVESRKHNEWHRFGADAIGLHVDELDRETLRFRLDDHECRFLIQNGPREDLIAAGWQVDDHQTFDEILRRVADRGVPITEGSAEECALRGVERLWRFPGPKGIATEVFTTAWTTPSPLRMLNTAFVTGESGMGHLAITTVKPQQLRNYFNTVFDARITDFIDENINGLTLKIKFLRVNERHHSIAIANLRGVPIQPIRTTIQHMNIEVATLEDMLASFQRVKELGFHMAWSVGQHTNDRELSYYSVTPSGFELEVGWNPVRITPELESTWEPTTYKGISIWGHTPQGNAAATLMGQFQQSVRHFRSRETTVPELSEASR
ncbi:MAG: VOC family protein [Nocardioides sp.]|uniref:VOC family protein n=1 Tax=Nocardioides sp. TaxID=35761 RepID=UPI0039E2E0F6